MGPITETVQVLERHKVRLPTTVSTRVSALAASKTAVTGIAIPGHFGGIQIFFGEAPLASLREKIDKMIVLGKATADESGKSWTLLARSLSNVWDVTFSLYNKVFTMVLPTTARDLGLVPKNKGDIAVIFVYGEIFEIWPSDAWVALASSVRPRIDLLEADLDEAESNQAESIKNKLD